MLALFVTILALTLTAVCSEAPVRLGPSFAVEPPAVVRYAASAGTRVACLARGDPLPRVSWLHEDGTTLDDIPGIRRVHSNGTLELFPARAAAATTLRCRAASPRGAIVSRDVLLQPVMDAQWEVSLMGATVAAGGVAALRCRVAPRALAEPALFYRGERVLHVDAPRPDARYIVAGDALLLRDAAAADAGAYSCLARHHLTANTKRSRPALLAVLPSSPSGAPRLMAAETEVSARAGAALCLPCVASDYPPPQYTWYRERGGRLEPVADGGGGGGGALWLWAGGAALCVARVAREHSGAWLCKAYNVFGDATMQVRLDVLEPFSVTVTPEVVVAEAGGTVRLNCSSSAPDAALSWLRDGAALPGAAAPALLLRGVTRARAGLYQCVARRGARSEQAAAEVRLGDSPPELQYTFIEQALRGGGDVALRCVAAAAPPPRFTWLLDGQPLEHYLPRHRYSISEEASAQGEVTSTLNVTAAAAGDGGRYTCRATNALGAAEHSARLNIYGPPSVRRMSTVRAVAGDNLTLHCPYTGYPISSVWWTRHGAAAALAGAGRVSASGGALRLAPALPHDAGRYACSVAAPPAPTATGDLEIQVRNPPKISPFMFSSELTEGSSVQVLCGVSSGDKPMYFSWFKDGAPLPPSLQIEEKSLSEFSLLVFPQLSARHSGAYTCRAANSAAAANYTAVLSVRVAPAWVTEPLDAAVLLGAPLLLQCAARGQPAPAVAWHRRIGEGINALDNSEQWVATGGEWSAEAGGGAGGADEGVGRSVLAARAATRALQGRYRCSADNGVGAPLLKHVNVTVHEPAHFGAEGETPRNVSAVRGAGVALACLALGDAPLHVHWTHRGHELELDSYRWSISEERRGAGLRSKLRLRGAEARDAGEYRCHARNAHGRAAALILLTVEEAPGAPRALRLAGAEPRAVRVCWRARGAGAHFAALLTPLHAPPAHDAHDAPALYNLTVEEGAIDDVDAEGYRALCARVRVQRAAAAYSLRLVASNHVGPSPPSAALLFTTLEEAPSGSPQNVRVRPVNSEELLVSWSSPAQDSWNGELLGYAVSWHEMGAASGAGGAVGVDGAGGADWAEGPREATALRGTAVARGWSSAELTLGGLRPFARYALTARAFNRAGSGPPSDTAYAATSDGLPEEPPTSVSCEALSARSLRVRWLPPARPSALPLRGYDVLYAPLHRADCECAAARVPQCACASRCTPGDASAACAAWGAEAARAAPGGEALLGALRAATNYSVSVRARSERGAGPASPPLLCRTRDDVPSAPEPVRALAAGREAVRVVWAAPARSGGALTHYTLYSRELGKAGGERAARVAPSAGADADEAWHEVRGLRERAVYEFWVRAATAAGEGAPSRAVSAAPQPLRAARIWSLGRVVRVAPGARVRLRCGVLGAPPVARRWVPLPQGHSVTDDGDLVIHKVEADGNYSCSARNAHGGDAAAYALRVRRAPAAPALRLARAARHELGLAWEPPADGGEPLLGYTLTWWAGADAAAAVGARRWRVGGAARGATLRGLACGAPYRATLTAHNAVGASPPARVLALRTRGDKAAAPAGKECIWANSTALRVALLAWGGRCAVARFALALRRAGGAWADLPARAGADSAEATDLEPGTWYEIRVWAHSPAGDTAALYRAATLTANGERIGEPVELPLEARMSSVDGEEGAPALAAAWWRGGAGAAAALLALACALLLGAAALLVRRARKAAASAASRPCDAHAQPLYVAQPTHNGKSITPPDGSLHEISPYATFSMSSAGAGEGEAARSCALHLRSLPRAPHAPHAPHPLAHPNEYGSARDSDSESSGSPCAACAAELYRLPAARLADTLPASAACAESSTEDGSYARRDPPPRARARRREHARAAPPAARYFPAAAAPRRAHH